VGTSREERAFAHPTGSLLVIASEEKEKNAGAVSRSGVISLNR
jgi:hypothetical protein